MAPDEQLSAAQKLLDEAIELLNEAKRYRGSFYKQRVAEIQIETNKLFKNHTNGTNTSNKSIPKSL